MSEACWICGKQKGQPPERCNGHYLDVDYRRIAQLEAEVAELRARLSTLARCSDDILGFPFGVMSDDTYLAFCRARSELRAAIDAADAAMRKETR